MCLAIPVRVERIIDQRMALVEMGGIERQVSIELLEEPPNPGEYVLIHTGFAISKLSQEEAHETLELFKEIQEFSSS